MSLGGFHDSKHKGRRRQDSIDTSKRDGCLDLNRVFVFLVRVLGQYFFFMYRSGSKEYQSTARETCKNLGMKLFEPTHPWMNAAVASEYARRNPTDTHFWIGYKMDTYGR